MMGRKILISGVGNFIFFRVFFFLKNRFDAEFGIRRAFADRFSCLLNPIFWFRKGNIGCGWLSFDVAQDSAFVGFWFFRFWFRLFSLG
ncbi:hypothetical protein DTW91_11095 [Chryseobacterium sp. SC28]|nr:hypothetical protein DTW91_11095 [Chryseobacterium sp. SC28]